MQCPGDTREQWRMTTIQKVRAAANAFNQDPALTNLLIKGIQAGLEQLNAMILPHTVSPHYQDLVHAQNEIGWLNLFRGRWAMAWRTCWSNSAAQRGDNQPTITASKIVKHCGQILLSQWLNLWNLRNEECHGRDQEETKARIEQETQSMLQEIYSLRLGIMPVDQHIYPYATAYTYRARGQSSPNTPGVRMCCPQSKPANNKPIFRVLQPPTTYATS